MTMARVARLAVAKMRLAMVAILRSVAALFRSPRPRNNLIPTIAGGPESSSIVVTPIFTEPSPSSTGPLPTWIIEGSGTGGTSGGSGGTTGANSVVNQASGGLVINVVYDPGVSNAPAAFTADVQSVVNYYESHFSNPITITIDVGYGEVDGQSLGSGALGESITYFGQVSYSQLQSALVANLNANGNSTAAATLPATAPVSGQWWVSTAEAEALGITSTSNNPDGYVGFSSTANIFAYNDSNGVPSNQYDFTAVVAHEISEVMGRQMFDGTKPSAPARAMTRWTCSIIRRQACAISRDIADTLRRTLVRPTWTISIRCRAAIWPIGHQAPAMTCPRMPTIFSAARSPRPRPTACLPAIPMRIRAMY
jgi:hypothetical protein